MDEGGSDRFVHTTHVVVLKDSDVSVVTVMIDYQGPRTKFALLLPVPRDVDATRVRTLRREIVSRLEQVSAPRLHEFYEKDPCEPGRAEQAWEERLRPRTRGFLTPRMLPPPDSSYRISNEMSIPSQPVFKGEESEFAHWVLTASSERELEAKLSRRGYRISKSAASRLNPHLGPGAKLLLSEVQLDRVELVGNNAIQLGGIRYTTREKLPLVASTLGLLHSAGTQDLFIYVLDSKHRYEAANYPNVFSPTNVAVAPQGRLHLGSAYNALFDHVVAKEPRFVTEYVWSTEGCGEPCPNAPLQLRELLSLGGDEVEAELSRVKTPKANQPTEKVDPDEQALEERRALIARQRYVLTRLHYRYKKTELARDVGLRPAAGHVRGGVGIPKGPSAELLTTIVSSPQSTFQTRFFASHPWSGTTPCKQPVRWRWGKRWKSMGRVSRQVPLALDLPRVSRDASALRQALVRPIAGLSPVGRTSPPAATPKKTSTKNTEASSAAPTSGGCTMTAPRPGRHAPVFLTVLALGVVGLRRRASAPAQRRPWAGASFEEPSGRVPRRG